MTKLGISKRLTEGNVLFPKWSVTDIKNIQVELFLLTEKNVFVCFLMKAELGKESYPPDKE